MIWFVPLEPLEERYTAQMYKWVIDGLKRMDLPYNTIDGISLTNTIETGEVLDAAGTNYYKATQLMQICELFHEGQISDGDMFFIADLWFPGIEMIRYIEAQMGIHVQIGGVHYAGVFDPYDFTRKMAWWAIYNETGWLRLADHIFVGSQFHKDLILSGLGDFGLINSMEPKIHVTGLVWDADDIEAGLMRKERKVIFPHRLDMEKDPEMFFRVATQLHNADPTIKFIVTSSRKEYASNIPGLHVPDFIQVKFGLTKQQYYDELASSKVFFSSAKQETFGYALNEALALGCIPICPNRLSYPEVLQHDERLLYETPDEAIRKILIGMNNLWNFRAYTEVYSHNVDTMLALMMGGDGD